MINTPKASYTTAAEQIKEAILSSQYTAAKQVNTVQLSLYYGVGRYVSKNTRKGVWGTGAIKAISEQLHKELPGLRGFSERNIKNMRAFYEAWQELDTNLETTVSKLQMFDNKSFINSAATAAELETILAVATAEMPEQFQRVLPNIEELRKVLSNQPTDK